MSALKKMGVPLLLAALVGFYLFQKYRVPPSVAFEKLPLQTLDGNAFSWKTTSGHPVVVNFFATWCGPCMREMPLLASLKETHSTQALQVICITDEPVEKVTALAQRFEGQLLFLQLKKPLKEIGVHTFPTTYILNMSGEIVFEQTGEISKAKEKFERLLSESFL